MSDPFLGEIKMFAETYPPRYYAFCNGTLLAIAEHKALFSLLGSAYGSDGRTTMRLPNLQSRAPLRPGQGPSLMQSWPAAKYEIILEGKAKIGRLYQEYRENEICVIDISLLPQYRGKGIGRQIMQDVIEKAAALDKAVRIHVEKLNPAMNLYRRLGFNQIGGTDVYDLMEWNKDTPKEQLKQSR